MNPEGGRHLSISIDAPEKLGALFYFIHWMAAVTSSVVGASPSFGLVGGHCVILLSTLGSKGTSSLNTLC